MPDDKENNPTANTLTSHEIIVRRVDKLSRKRIHGTDENARMWLDVVLMPKRVSEINCESFTHGWTGIGYIKAVIPFVKGGGNETPPK